MTTKCITRVLSKRLAACWVQFDTLVPQDSGCILILDHRPGCKDTMRVAWWDSVAGQVDPHLRDAPEGMATYWMPLPDGPEAPKNDLVVLDMNITPVKKVMLELIRMVKVFEDHGNASSHRYDINIITVAEVDERQASELLGDSGIEGLSWRIQPEQN